MIVIGTAGHIDHGKSSIVKRLTGTDPDRLPEEKARGMTIDLGFAFHKTHAGDIIAFVDVPGHERFVKNMIAGAGGTDAVMLVIAADDGWMPQSEEHFQVVRLLGVQHGLIVINKTDLVEKDWLELLIEDVRNKVAGSFLADAPILTVSAQTGFGFEELSAHLEEITQTVEARKDMGKPRLCIDRSFVRPGIGGVATGTLRGGSFALGQTVSLWPSQLTAKIRSLQSNGQEVKTAVPGQRTAISLTGINRELLVRGGVISDRMDLSFFKDQAVLALSVELLKDAPVSIADRRRVVLIVGTSEVEGELRLFEKSEIRPSQKGIVFFKPDDPTYALIGDHFIMRLPTPMVTLGGGTILDHLSHFPRRKLWANYEYLHERLSGLVEDVVLSELRKHILVPRERLLAESDFSRSEVKKNVAAMSREGQVGSFEGHIFRTEVLENAATNLRDGMTAYLESKPHLKGVPLEQLLHLSPFPSETTDILIKHMLSGGVLLRSGGDYNLSGRDMSLKGPVKKAYNEIIDLLRQEKYTPPTLSKLADMGKPYREAIKFILDSGEAHKCGTHFLFITEVWSEIIEFVRERLTSSQSLAVPDLRERFGYTRKFAIPILEEMDRIKLTRREGDVRIKGERFDDEEFDL
ncbi:MAG: selenocysteine-specific translation elongation factor [candidate division Zixibacteria bacterium]|nr:selenocysteine-specific translation elongation factor [candidate division Zixibacteria bacterium]